MVRIHRLRGRRATAAILAAGLFFCASVAATPQRVLVIHSFGRDIEPYAAIESVFRTSLARSSQRPVVIHETTVDAGQPDNLFDEKLFIAHLRDRFHGSEPDVVVTFGPPASRFYVANRAKLFADKPYVMAAVEARVAAMSALGPGDAAVTSSIDFTQLVDHILELMPASRTLAVVVGDSAIERFWAEQMRQEFARFAGRLDIVWLVGMSLDQMRTRVAALPARSAIFYASLRVDAAGIPHARQSALGALKEVANAPIFGLYESEIGNGVVGGPYLSQQRRGELAAQATVRALNGERGATPTVERTGFERPAYDWRELRRWNIDTTRLPADADVRFRPPSLWEEHRETLVLVAAALLLQFALIAALMLQRGRARRAEREARDLGGQLITAHEDERRRIARELHDDVTQRLARLSIDAALIGRQPTAQSEHEVARALREELVRLSDDVHALSHQLHPAVLEDLGLVEALRAEGDRLVRFESIACKVETQGVPPNLRKEVALCLFRVAQEAMRNVARHARASAVDIAVAPQGDGLELTVADNGRGFEPGRGSGRPSLGLASMRERVRLLRGTLEVDSGPGRGTKVHAWVPLRDAA
jgi:signal transduction histidine kinase